MFSVGLDAANYFALLCGIGLLYNNRGFYILHMKHKNNISSRAINKSIKHLGLEICKNGGDGYAYFLDLTTGTFVGESVMICYLNQQSIEQWVAHAIFARKQSKQ